MFVGFEVVEGFIVQAAVLAAGPRSVSPKTRLAGMTSCLGRNVLSGVIEGGIDGGASGGISYLTSGQPITVGGFLSATAEGAGSGAVMGGAGGALSKVSGVAKYGCFTADTEVLMADGTSKPIDQVAVGEQVLAFNPETGQNESAEVTDTQRYEAVATIRLATSDGGEITTTVNHPFYAEDRGWTPAGELHAGDLLHTPDGREVRVDTIQPTGQVETVYNLTIDRLHNYHVTNTQHTPVLVHNDGGVDEQCGIAANEGAGGFTSLTRASPAGRSASDFEHGYDPADFPGGPGSAYPDGRAYFGVNDSSIANEYSRLGSYDSDVIVTRIPNDVFEREFKMHVSSYDGGPRLQIGVPRALIPRRNEFPRFWSGEK